MKDLSKYEQTHTLVITYKRMNDAWELLHWLVRQQNDWERYYTLIEHAIVTKPGYIMLPVWTDASILRMVENMDWKTAKSTVVDQPTSEVDIDLSNYDHYYEYVAKSLIRRRRGIRRRAS